jgi:hypothetical protein
LADLVQTSPEKPHRFNSTQKDYLLQYSGELRIARSESVLVASNSYHGRSTDNQIDSALRVQPRLVLPEICSATKNSPGVVGF